MQGLTVQSLNEHSAVNDNSSLVLKVRVPCISKLNNEEIIIKDSSAPLKQDTSGLSNIYTGRHSLKLYIQAVVRQEKQ